MNIGNKTAILYITGNGLNLAQRLKELYPDARLLKFKPETVSELWDDCRNLIFIMAAGIVVRTIASLIKDKKTDPAVVGLDEKGKFAISLLSGHSGGANKVAKEIANFLGGEAVITTASDVNNMTPVDLWAEENDLVIENRELFPHVVARFINNGALRLFTEIEIEIPDDFLRVAEPRFGDVLITNKKDVYLDRSPCTYVEAEESIRACRVKDQVYLRPRNLVIGIGCNRGTLRDEIEEAVKGTLDEHNLSLSSIESVATIDKKADEPGLIAFAEKYELKINTFTPEELNSVAGVPKSEAALRATGAIGVAAPAALLSSGADKLIIPKQKRGNVTVAVAELNAEKKEQEKGHIQGRIYIVGTGHGSIEHITPYARNAIRKSDVIVGYGTYIDLIQELIKDKKVISTGMTQEIDRCKKAAELARGGRTVSVISGGDPGIYAMAGLVFEILRTRAQENKNLSGIHVEVIPGISASNACASRLGAPLMHDFAVISLSDRLTPWELIEKRLEAASLSDFIIVLYNPRSAGRQGHIKRARDIVLKYRAPETPVGIVKAAMRDNEKTAVTNLQDMLDHDIDMQATVIIGNSQTFTWNNWMITPRGYENKFKI